VKPQLEERELRQRIIGRFLKRSREKAGFTQQELASRLSYTSAQFISNWERGLSMPPMDVLPRVAVTLKVTPRELIDVLHEYQDELLKLQKKQVIQLFRKKLPKAR
jgi:transcriptional regulator with XRE-family HTH domain